MLTKEEVNRLFDRAKTAQSEWDAALASLPPAIQSRLPDKGTPSSRTYKAIQILNRTRPPPDGELPLLTVLDALRVQVAELDAGFVTLLDELIAALKQRPLPPVPEPRRSNLELTAEVKRKELWTYALGGGAALAAIGGGVTFVFTDITSAFVVTLIATLVFTTWAFGVTHLPARVRAAPKVRFAARIGYALALVAIGFLIAPTAWRIYDHVREREDVAEYFLSYVSVEGTEQQCATQGCVLHYRIGGRFRSNTKPAAEYIDRVKTSGRIVSMTSVPAYTVRNPAQFPANPTYLEFAIDGTGPILEPTVDLVMTKSLTPASGKIGFHLPYRTRGALLMIDLTKLDFRPQSQIMAFLETLSPKGVSNLGVPIPLRYFETGQFVIVPVPDIAPRTSVVLRWGD